MSTEDYPETVELTTLDILEENIQNAEKSLDAKNYAEAYQALLEANLAEVEAQERIENEKKRTRIEKLKGWLAFAGAVLGAVGGAFVSGELRNRGDLEYQERAQRYEDEGAYTNYRKHKR